MDNSTVMIDNIIKWIDEHQDIGRFPYLSPNEKTRYVVDAVELKKVLNGLRKDGAENG